MVCRISRYANPRAIRDSHRWSAMEQPAEHPTDDDDDPRGFNRRASTFHLPRPTAWVRTLARRVFPFLGRGDHHLFAARGIDQAPADRTPFRSMKLFDHLGLGSAHT